MEVLPLLLSFTLFIMRSVSRGNGITTAEEMLKVGLHGWGSAIGIVLEDDVEGCIASMHDPCLSSEELSIGPLKPRADPAGESKDQAKERMAPLARITDDEDDESPPAYVRRYMPQEKKTDDLDDLELSPPEPVQEPHDVRLDPEFQQQANRRRARRHMQNLVEGPCSLRPDSPNRPPLPVPEPYPDPDLQLQPAGAPVPGQGVAAFQFPFHTLLLTWPLSTTIMGVLNSSVCFKRSYLPYVMIGVGLLGTITTLLRLFVLYYEKLFSSDRTKNFWIGIRTTEFIIWIVFAIQLYVFFEHAPSFTPGDKHYCKPRFYKINCGLMFLSSATMIGWIVVNVGNFIHSFRTRNEGPSA
ncbi:hypothetical protein AVEN_142906-1 [Araneus ventricosus]|uniref:Uncharacterized protein n=1 Tax=Araneus ventricosus TaxID=182803 RepID=A0A4Y2FNL8_ARAVE|nr:hypothetical protein AVEN_142906-1 [Araneus ventricosus]